MSRVQKKRCDYGNLLLIALLLGIGTSALLAQSLGGTLRGRVRDASGGVIAGAELTARDTGRGLVYETRSDDLGLYQITLPVGTYELEAVAAEFQMVKETGITQITGGVIVFPSATGSPTGGQIFRAVTDARQIQFSLRYRF